MPRPGPRPYECVRRAWHSDRHQPIRGSLIQQIFRVINEAHTANTKKNKEWQEKLPIVVLKAEEIMYSKANSEAEYSNLETLWDRLNDAINTIIRREETTETGDLLPPCVEAALNLGCIPVRASRSQRLSNPRNYLTPTRPHEPPNSAARVADRASDERHPPLLPFHSGSQLHFARNPAGNSPIFHPESNTLTDNRHNNIAVPRSHASFSPENILTGYSQAPAMDTNTSLNVYSVYPLYYGIQFRTEDNQSGSQVPETTHSKTIYVGTPETMPTAVVESRRDYFSREDIVDTRENHPREEECDLSLRLGMLSKPVERSEKSLARENDDFSSTKSPELSKLNETHRLTNKEFCFFPGNPASDIFESSSKMWNSGGEGQSLEAAIRKGKKPFS